MHDDDDVGYLQDDGGGSGGDGQAAFAADYGDDNGDREAEAHEGAMEVIKFIFDAKLSRKRIKTLLNIIHMGPKFHAGVPKSAYLVDKYIDNLRAVTAAGGQRCKRLDVEGLGLPERVAIKGLTWEAPPLEGLLGQLLDDYRSDVAFACAPEFRDKADGSGQERVYGGPLSCDAAREAQQKLNNKYGGNPDGAGQALLVVFGADKTQSRSHGQQVYHPLYTSIANLSRKAYDSPVSKRLVGLIPVVKKPDSTKSSKVEERAFKTANNKVEYGCWADVLDDLIALEAKGIRFNRAALHAPEPDVILLRPVLFLVLGDHPELQLLCGATPSSGSCLPCRVCWCPKEELATYYTMEQLDSGAAPFQYRTAAATRNTLRNLIFGLLEVADPAVLGPHHARVLRAVLSLRAVCNYINHASGYSTDDLGRLEALWRDFFTCADDAFSRFPQCRLLRPKLHTNITINLGDFSPVTAAVHLLHHLRCHHAMQQHGSEWDKAVTTGAPDNAAADYRAQEHLLGELGVPST